MLLREFTQAIGTCPGDMHSWKHPNGCREFCNAIGDDISNEIALCWRTYFEEKIAGKVGKSGK
jgi:sarcosine oxidase delta subunit